MTSHSLPRTRFQHLRPLRALALGLAIGFASPSFADNVPEIQRLIKQGQFPQALEKVDAYLSSRPKDAQGRFLKGLILTEMNKPAEAIAVFTKLTEDYPELPEPYNNLAVLYAQQKQYDKARSSLEMAIRTHPSYAIAYENLGDIYAKLASQAYDKALQLDNSNSATQNKLSLIRDLITAGSKANVKPQPAPAVQPTAATATPVPAAASVKPAAQPPAVAPTATVVTATQGAAATSAAPAAPAAKPAPAPAKAETGNEDVAKALNAWVDAWSRKDVKAYLAAYASNFDTPKGMSRKAWEQEREARIVGKPGKISVTIDDPKIAVSGDRATVRFRQHYSAGSLKTSTPKTLVLTRAGSKWLIVEENAR